MLFPKRQWITLACLTFATAACSQSASDSATTSGANAVPTSAPADDSATSNAAPLDCNKIFTSADAAGILDAPIKLSRNPMSNGCTFENDRVAIQVSSGGDFTSEMSWKDVTASPDRANFVDLPGVGDQARRRASNGYEVLSKKGRLYCFASRSSNTTANIGGEELAKRLGALCNKVFTAHRTGDI
jgi:hypothetical protein